LFNQLDYDKDGYLNFRDLCFSFEERQIKWDIDDAKKTFKALDTEKTKSISLETFLAAMEKIDTVPTIFIQSLQHFSNSPFQSKELNICPKENEMKEATLESILSALQKRDPDWQGRVAQLQRLTNLLEKLSDEEFLERWEEVSKCLSEQLQDRRSSLIPHACDALSNILKPRTHLNPNLSIYKTLCLCVRMNVKIIREAAIKCASNLSILFGVALLPELQHALSEKHGIVRQTSLDLVTDLLKRTDEINDWEAIELIIIQGIGDADPGARKSCGRALKTMESKFKNHFDTFYEKQSAPQKKRIDRARGVKRKRQGLKFVRKRKKEGVVA